MHTSKFIIFLAFSSAAVGCVGENPDTDVVDTEVVDTDVVDTEDTDVVDTDIEDTDVVDTDIEDTDVADTDIEDPDVDADGFTVGEGDCDDDNSAVNPGATETCNGVDDNCDDSTDEGLLISFYEDSDGDGYGGSNAQLACAAPDSSWVENDEDCDDANPAVNPDATDGWNHIDDDCDGEIDPGILLVGTVNDVTADDGLCSLREAIVAANTDTASGATPGECPAGSTSDIIDVPVGEFAMNNGVLALGDGVRVVGAGSGQTTIVGGSGFELQLGAGSMLEDCDVEAATMYVSAGSSALWGADGQVTLSEGLLNEGTILGGSGLLLDAGGIENGENALLSAPSLELISGADLTNHGDCSSQDSLVATVAGDFLNGGTLAAPRGNIVSYGDIDISAGAFTNHGTVDADMDITIGAGSISNSVVGGDTREWYESASTPDHLDSTNAYYQHPDNYEIQYWSRTYTLTQQYTGGTPAFAPSISCQGTLVLENFDAGVNLGGRIEADQLHVDATANGAFLNDELELSQEHWTQSWEVYTHYIALGPLMYDDHVRQNDQSNMTSSSVLSTIGAGLYANDIEYSGGAVP